MIFNMISAGNNAASAFPEFTYSGTYTLVDDGFDENTKTQNWRIKFLSSGTLNFSKVVDKLDVFMVGGGAGGGQPDLFYGGGGGGGYVTTHSDLSLEKDTDYTITVGGGGGQFGGGGTTSAFGYSIGGGSPSPGKRKGGSGGSGGGGGGGGTGGSNGGSGSNGTDGEGGAGSGKTTREFGESTGALYAGGGGGAGEGGGYGGSGGGGRGDYSAGTANTGGGGGGGHQAGFGGGSGIVILRNSRAVWA